MNEDEIRKMVVEYGFNGTTADAAFRLAMDVERETRHNYFRLIQNANNAASSKEITAQDIDKLVWDKSLERIKKKL